MHGASSSLRGSFLPPRKRAGAEASMSGDATGARVAQLEAQLAEVKAANAALQHDVEALCMASQGASLWSKSSVLSDRLRNLESELAASREVCTALGADNASLRDDITAIRRAKKVVDDGWRAERQRASGLDKELGFYQSQSAKALAERDAAAYEAEQLRSASVGLELAARGAEGRAAAEAQGREALKAQLRLAQQQLEHAQAQAERRGRQAAGVPQLEARAKAAEAAASAGSERVTELEGVLVALRGELAQCQSRLEDAVRQRSEAVAQLQKAQALRNEDVEAMAKENMQLQKKIDDQEGHIAKLEELPSSQTTDLHLEAVGTERAGDVEPSAGAAPAPPSLPTQTTMGRYGSAPEQQLLASPPSDASAMMHTSVSSTNMDNQQNLYLIMVERFSNLEKSLVILRRCRKSLQRAGMLLWGASENGGHTAQRDAALGEIGRIHDEVRAAKRQAGLNTHAEDEVQRSEDSDSSAVGVVGFQNRQIDRIVLAEGLRLVDFGLGALGKVNTMYAYSQLMDF